MSQLELSAATLLAAPILGATLLALLSLAPPGPTVRRVVNGVTVITLATVAAGLIAALGLGGVVGQAQRTTLGLGPLDPATSIGAVAWTVGPVALALLFLLIALRARSVLLGGLSLAQLAVAVAAAVPELRAAGSHSEVAAAPLVLDPLAGLLLAVSVVVGGLIVLYAVDYEPGHLEHRHLPAVMGPRFLAWLVAFMAAMHLLVLADDVRLLIVGWEVTTLCSFVLIGFDGDAEAVSAARRALAYNLAGGIALGVVPLALGSGASISELLATAAAGPTGAVSLVPLALAGCVLAAAVKSALAPFHPWLLGAMVAAAPVSALLHASAMVKAGSYLLLRLSPAIAAVDPLGPALAILGGLTFVGAALLALREHDLKRVLALSTVSSLGLIAASAGLGTPAAMAAGALLLAFHAVAKALAFLVTGAIEQAAGSRDVEALVGIVRRQPRLGAAFLVAAAAMALPPFGLAVAKWALLVLGAPDVALVTLLAVGGAASLALWTGVTARLIVRREGVATAMGSTPVLMGAALGVLATMATVGLVLAGPVANLIADPAAAVSFGSSGGLAHGWSVALERAGFAVPLVAVLAVVAFVAALVVARRIPLLSPQPYLAGANVGPGGSVAFHGPRADAVEATSGGFYWGAARTATRGWAISLDLAGAVAVALVVAATVAATFVRVTAP
jgi:ech hydrogenase subunit A